MEMGLLHFALINLSLILHRTFLDLVGFTLNTNLEKEKNE